MKELHYDLCIIGGGINGAGIARDAAGRGLSVLLVEAADLAGATSSASSKLIHGGLRYLENYEFGMVRAALKEREILFKTAPHLVRPAEFVLPLDKKQRPRWMIAAGLFLYDHLGGRHSFNNSRYVNLRTDPVGNPLKAAYDKGFIYTDCWVDDTRLVVLNAADAAVRGAKIRTRTICEGLSVMNGRWRVELRDAGSGEKDVIQASMVVNATGPWVSKFLNQVGIAKSDFKLPRVRLVKGSHIIVPRQFDGDQYYILQQPDKRIVFVMPYEKDYTLIGTTEVDYTGDPRDATISESESKYLCAAFNAAFEKVITPNDMIFTFSGVRPLFDDGTANASKVTRDYKIYHHKRYAPPFLSVFGGKLTTYRVLSEKTVTKLVNLSGKFSMPWTTHRPLTGGDLPVHDFQSFLYHQHNIYPWLPIEMLARYGRSYGTRMNYFLLGKSGLEDMGQDFGNNVYAAEIDYLRKYEFAGTIEDILWRRSKLGLHIEDKTVSNIEDYLRSLPQIK